MIKLFKHQKAALIETSDKNRVALKGFEGLYEADIYGNIYSLLNNKILKPCIRNKGGYLYVNLYKNGKGKKYYIHRLIANTFIQNPDNLKEVNHINCDKTDNSVSNLEWCDRKSNLQHSYDNGLKRTGENHGCHKLTWDDVHEIRSSDLPIKELSKKFNIAQCTVSAIKLNRIWKEGGAICQ